MVLTLADTPAHDDAKAVSSARGDKAINTYEHHASTVRGGQRTERNMLRAITDDFGRLDRTTLSTLNQVLA
jgi:hypothetical protein